MTNSFIDSNDMSGDAFLSNLVHDTPTISEYINNATNGGVYDFKETNGQSGCVGEDHYRGMPIGETGDGLPIYASARDVGNIGAGYVAAINGMSWKEARIGFDAYQSYVSHGPRREGLSTRAAEAYGYRLGYNSTSPVKKADILKNSLIDAVSKALNWISSKLF